MVYVDTFELKHIMHFREDSVTVTIFNETFYDGFWNRSFLFHVENDSIYFEGPDSNSFVMQINLLQEELELFFSGGEDDWMAEDQRARLRRMEHYHMGLKQDSIIDYLTTTPIQIDKEGDSLEYLYPEWYHMGKIVPDNLSSRFTEFDDWYTVKLGGELFVGLGDQVIQVNKFSRDQLQGEFCFADRGHVNLLKIESQAGFQFDLLQGVWIRSQQQTYQVEDGPLNRSAVDFIDQIQINKSDFVAMGESFSDTVSWKVSKMRNKLVIGGDYSQRLGNYWKINRLTSNEFRFERISPYHRNHVIEELRFERKE